MKRTNGDSVGVDMTVFGHVVHFTGDDIEALVYVEVLDVLQKHPEWTVEQVAQALVNDGWGVYEAVLEVVVLVVRSGSA